MDKPKTSSIDFDELRARWPTFGFAVYAYSPGGPVIAEVLTHGEAASFDGQIQATGETADKAMRRLAEALSATVAPTVLYAERLGREILEFAPEPDVFG